MGVLGAHCAASAAHLTCLRILRVDHRPRDRGRPEWRLMEKLAVTAATAERSPTQIGAADNAGLEGLTGLRRELPDVGRGALSNTASRSRTRKSMRPRKISPKKSTRWADRARPVLARTGGVDDKGRTPQAGARSLEIKSKMREPVNHPATYRCYRVGRNPHGAPR